MQGVFFRVDVRRARHGRSASAGGSATPSTAEVEAEFEGEPDAVDAIVAWCSEGPPFAHVDGIDVRQGAADRRAGFPGVRGSLRRSITPLLASAHMFLRSISIRGFKSFADKTVLEFIPGVSVIVGPNGSGKSNLVDAISWVLGEQGARSLRGGHMADVIFAGTPSRPRSAWQRSSS